MTAATENPKHYRGQTKSCIHFMPLKPISAAANVLAIGAAKYGLRNWRKQQIRSSTYIDAIFRHLTEWSNGSDVDPESMEHPLAHIIANCTLVLDAIDHNSLIDDRDHAECLIEPEKQHERQL